MEYKQWLEKQGHTPTTIKKYAITAKKYANKSMEELINESDYIYIRYLAETDEKYGTEGKTQQGDVLFQIIKILIDAKVVQSEAATRYERMAQILGEEVKDYFPSMDKKSKRESVFVPGKTNYGVCRYFALRAWEMGELEKRFENVLPDNRNDLRAIAANIRLGEINIPDEVKKGIQSVKFLCDTLMAENKVKRILARYISMAVACGYRADYGEDCKNDTVILISDKIKMQALILNAFATAVNSINNKISSLFENQKMEELLEQGVVYATSKESWEVAENMTFKVEKNSDWITAAKALWEDDDAVILIEKILNEICNKMEKERTKEIKLKLAQIKPEALSLLACVPKIVALGMQGKVENTKKLLVRYIAKSYCVKIEEEENFETNLEDLIILSRTYASTVYDIAEEKISVWALKAAKKECGRAKETREKYMHYMTRARKFADDAYIWAKKIKKPELAVEAGALFTEIMMDMYGAQKENRENVEFLQADYVEPCERVAGECESILPLFDEKDLKAWSSAASRLEKAKEYRGVTAFIKPQAENNKIFDKAYYVGAFDSEFGKRQGYVNTDIQPILMKLLLSGKKVVLTVNQICDNMQILQLCDDAGFLNFLQKGYVVVSFFNKAPSLRQYVANNIQNEKFVWSSMSFLNDMQHGREETAQYMLGNGGSFGADIELMRDRLRVFEENLPMEYRRMYYQTGHNYSETALKTRLSNFYNNGDRELDNLKTLHNIIDCNMSSATYDRSEYKRLAEQLGAENFAKLTLTDNQKKFISRYEGDYYKDIEKVWTVASNEYNVILGGYVSPYQHHVYTEEIFVPQTEGIKRFDDVSEISSRGLGIDFKQAIECVEEMDARNKAGENSERIINAVNSAKEIKLAHDCDGNPEVEFMAVKITDGQRVTVENSCGEPKDEENKKIHMEGEM